MNTDMSRNTPQTRTLCSFVEDKDLHLCIKSDCADVPFTFCSKSNGSKSSIEHLIVSQNVCEYINKYEAMFMNSDFSDHVPIRLELNINVLHLQTKLRIQKTNVAWHNCSDVHIANYKIELDKQLECIDLTDDSTLCTNYRCQSHNQYFSEMYNNIVHWCIFASNTTLPMTSDRLHTDNKLIPGWNEHVQRRHDTSLLWHDIWCSMW